VVFYALALPTGLSVAAKALVALVISWICIELYRGTQNPGIHKGDALMLDLGLGLAAVAAAVLWFSISLQILS
jgi:hypothetical protein